MKRNTKTLMIVTVVIVIISSITLYHLNTGKGYIEKVLESSSYSYLPKEAKEFVKEVYEETGEVILTEKNKKENVPYLNPGYVEYLTLSDKKEKVSLIPEVYTIDYLYTATEEDNEILPEAYDLRNVNGKNFITPLKDQGTTPTCWTFAAVEQVESYLMVKKNESYNDSTEILSPRQIDYATSTDGIANYNNEYGRRNLLDGGNFNISSEIMAYGLSAVNEEVMPFDEKKDTKEVSKVLNFNNSNYEVNGAITIPQMGNLIQQDKYNSICKGLDLDEAESCLDELELTLRDKTIREVKRGIMEYGGAVVATVSPQSDCGFTNEDGKHLIHSRSNCYSVLDSHAMQAIGWDDNYQYSYCEGYKKNTDVVDGTCKLGTKKAGKGAFIIRNSWGVSDYDYVYLTYDSVTSQGSYNLVDFSFVTSVSETKERNWDNIYPMNLNLTPGTMIQAYSAITQAYSKKVSGIEKLEKIKFKTFSLDGKYSLSIKTSDKTYSYDDIISTSLPGLYTIDLSDKNILLEDSDFTVSIKGDEKPSLYDQSIAVFTSNVDKTPIIETADMTADSKQFVVYSRTKNINSDEKINYSLYDGDEEVKNCLNVKNNDVAGNDVNSTLEIVKKIPVGVYTLKTEYDGHTYESKLTLTHSNNFDGQGTKNDPYLIRDEEGLKLIATDLNSFYRLEKDIVLQEKWIPIGTQETPFMGGFDGNGHSIINMKINDENLPSTGLFGYVKNSTTEETYIKNLTIKNAGVVATDNAGMLIGNLLVQKGYLINIEKIYIIAGNVSGNNAGAVIGNISGSNYNNVTVNIENIFSSATIRGTTSGLIGNTFSYQGKNIIITNIQNIGITYSENDNLYSNHNASILGSSSFNTINNFIITGYAKTDKKYFNHLIGAQYLNDGNFGYYLKGHDDVLNYTKTENNIYRVDSITELKNRDKYKQWNDFDSFWKMETIDGITRIPILKEVEFDYTTISNIEVNVDEEVSLLKYITPDTDAIRIQYEIRENENKIEVHNVYENGASYPKDIKIRGLKPGTTTLHIVSSYDGYENDITINVIGQNKEVSISFDANGGTGTMDSITVEEGEQVTVPANKYSKEGYKFLYWTTKIGGTGDIYNKGDNIYPESDLTLYAQWRDMRGVITYFANNGTQKATTQDIIIEENVKLKKNTFTREGYRFVSWNTKIDGTGETYTDEQEIENGNSMTLYAMWEEEVPYVISKYSCDENNKYISKIMENTTVTDFKKNIKLSSNYSINVEHKTINGKDVVYTGGKAKIYNGEDLYVEFTTIVIGDINGDGVINSADLLKIRQHLLGSKTLLGVDFIASDINYDETINSADLLKVRQHLLKIKTIS